MSKSMAILIGVSIYIVGIILIILTIYLIEKQNKKKLDKELARLETLKNLIISSGILTEMEKVKSLINNEKLLSTYEKWEKRYKQIEKESIPRLTDSLLTCEELIDNKKYKPYENTGIKEGDTIVKINNVQINSTDELIENVNKSNGKNIKINYIHEQETKECSIIPVETNKSEYKLGLWVRDSAAGVGTVTFYEPDTKTFGALGHGITDIDTNELINISSGEFITTRILNITKGESGTPGKIQGTIDNQKNIGTISKNTKFGIYGKVDNISSLNIDKSKEMEVALRDEIKTGKAQILCNLDNNMPQMYEVEIEKIYKENNYDNKSMQIKVTDNKLIEKTGGIIQGMSGSPILQNGKFVGAVTHVMVNNPLEGYGVFADIMLKKSKEIE
mgnify:CR=1 FL=1